MKTEVRDYVLNVTTDDGCVIRMIAHDDIATKHAVRNLEGGNRFALAVLLSMRREPPFTAEDFCKRVAEIAGQELLTGRRDPTLHGENIVTLPAAERAQARCAGCCADYRPGPEDIGLCPSCARFHEIAGRLDPC